MHRRWIWEDGTPYDYDDWHNWNDPVLHQDELCAMLSQSGWRGRDCDSEHAKFAYMCERGIVAWNQLYLDLTKGRETLYKNSLNVYMQTELLCQ